MFIGPNDSSGKAVLIHWSFGSRIARTIPWKDTSNIRVLILDPDEEKFIVFHIKDLPSSPSDPSLTTSSIPNVEAHLETFALGDRDRGGVFRSTSDQIKRLFLRRDSTVRIYPFRCETYPGQINLNVEEEDFNDELDPDDPEADQEEFNYRQYHTWASQRFFSIESDQQIVFHRAHTMRPILPSREEFTFISPSPGILYFAESQKQWGGYANRVMILHAFKSECNLVRDYKTHCELKKGCGARIYGDGDFVVFVKDDEMSIHSFNKRAIWNPSQIAWPEEILNLSLPENRVIFGP